MEESIAIRNAGLVILNPYFLMLFERFGLTTENQFNNEKTQLRAVHSLQYLATGLTQTQEHFMGLNKILCGVSLTHSIPQSIDFTNDEKELMNGLIQAAIAHWSAIGDSSIEGFRESWLMRDGFLSEKSDRWELEIEKRSYDILINQLPFSFSIIKFPWMDKPLHVLWPY